MTSNLNCLNPERIIDEYKSLVSFYASKYSRYGLSFDDLQQESMLGLLEAAKRFDSKQNANFATYAGYWIKKYILQALDRENKHSSQHTDLKVDTLANTSSAPPTTDNINVSLPDTMPPLEQQVLRLSFEQEKSIQEIASQLNLPAEKIRQTRSKALRRLRCIHSQTL